MQCAGCPRDQGGGVWPSGADVEGLMGMVEWGVVSMITEDKCH